MGDSMNSVEERPEYGFYAGYPFITTCLLIGSGGLILFIFGFFTHYFLNVVFWITGAFLIIVFFLSGIALLCSSIIADKEKGLNFDFVKEFNSAQILDCGCGTGRHAIPLAKQMSQDSFLTGIDIFDRRKLSHNALERVQKNAQLEGVSERTRFMTGSVTDIPFDDETFDVVTCMAVLHTLKGNHSKALTEIHRVLKPDGVFYMYELNKYAHMVTTGLFALLFFKKSFYWKDELEKHDFSVMSTSKEFFRTIFFSNKKKLEHSMR
ncbi:class I SAM-dependent methyltransferase [Candidatus Latescibacterota bacterium]